MGSLVYEAMLPYLVLGGVIYAFFFYGLFRSVKSGRGRKGFLAPIILLTCSAAFGAPAIIRISAYHIYGKFELVSYLASGALAVLTLCLYGPTLVSTLSPAKTAEALRYRKIGEVIILVGGIAMAAGLLFIAVVIWLC